MQSCIYNYTAVKRAQIKRTVVVDVKLINQALARPAVTLAGDAVDEIQFL